MNSETPRILIVDDDSGIREFMHDLLTPNGYSVDCVQSGRRGLKMMSERTYDLVISDIVMDEMNGIEFLRWVKEKDPAVPFLLMTGHASMESAIDALKLGAFDYMKKPVDNTEILITIKNALEVVRLRQEREILLKKITEYNQDLARKVRERTEDIKQAKDELEKAEKKYRSLVENSPDIIYVLDSEGCFSFVGGAVESLLGFTKKELIGTHFISIIWPEDVSKAKLRFNERRTGERSTKGFEIRLRTKGRKKADFEIDCLPVELHAFGIYDKSISGKDKKYQGTYGVARDISDLKQINKRLRERNRQMAAINDLGCQLNKFLSLDHVVKSALDGIVDAISPDLAMIFFRNGDELLLEGIWPDDPELFHEKIPVHRVGKRLCEMAISKGIAQYSSNIRSNSRCTLEECKMAGFHSFAALPFIGPDDILGVLGLASFKERDFAEQADFLEMLSREITPGVQNALLYEQISQSEERFRIAAQSVSDLIFEWNFRNNSLKWFGNIEGRLGYKRRDFERPIDAWIELIHPDDRKGFVAGMVHCQEIGSFSFDEYRIKGNDGSLHYLRQKCATVIDSNGKPSRLIGVCNDITEVKKAEEKLQKSQTMLQTVFDGISEPMIMLDRKLKIQMLNDAARKYYGLAESKDYNDVCCFTACKELPTPCNGCDIPMIIEKREMSTFEREGLMDSSRIEEITVFPLIKLGKDNASLIRISDITEKRKTQEQLIRTDRLSSLGQLSGGIAHEIRNPLSSIRLFVDILSDPDRFPRKTEEMEIIDDIRYNTNKLEGIVRRVLDFAKPSIKTRTKMNINGLIRDEIKLWSSKIRKLKIGVTLSLEKDLPPIFGDAIELRQVINNLVRNALDTSEKGSALSISASKKISSFHKDRQVVVIKVRDAGPGIHPEDKKKIFDPFFTTKKDGTGLGLSISYQIIKRHGGLISCESKPGEGTEFIIELPFSPEE
ncbi:MAG: PAS domain S-box protein [Deltaproteobacteria bacterium]|nr:PAS domain S-box protein [Deltaproteobacteria bacterium]